jgi:short-subunit dehydrogenase
MTEPSPFALISGASSGIGLELAKHLTHRGYDLMITAETPSSAPPPRCPALFEAVGEASRTCVQSFARASRNELGPSGVSVTALLPGSPGTKFSLERAWGTTP